MITVIVPVYNEERALPALLTRLNGLEGDHEVIFSDGGSSDGTNQLLAGRQVVCGGKGRGAQCNRAAAKARGDVLFFLHCDSVVEEDVLLRIRTAADKGTRWGCLTLRFDAPNFVYRMGEAVSNLRVRWGKIAFGDQGIFITRALFEEIGGFPELPVMEDYELSLRLKQHKCYPAQLKSPILTSARRFQAGGPLRVGWAMQRLRVMYRRGTDLETICQRYQDVRETNG